MVRRGGLSHAGAVALVTGVLALSLGVLAAGGLGTPDPRARPLDCWGGLLAAAAALPLLACRRAPLAVYAASCAATIALVGLDYPVDFPFAAVVALYMVALRYGGDPPPARRAAVPLAVLFLPAAVAAHAATGYRDGRLAPGLLFWALALAVAWLAGDRSRLRGERIGELEARAARTEREAERERRLTTAQERTRIARELHDSAGHAINVILVQAGAARLLHDRDPAGSRRAISTVEDVARDTIGEIDRIVHALREDDDLPPPADPAALHELLDRHRAGGLAVTARLQHPDRALPRSVAWAAYRILQEALTNAARHGTGTADVALRVEPGAVELTVTNPVATLPRTRGGGHGIVGMRERAGLLGGSLLTRVEHGVFRLHARLPHEGPAS
jgi:signal transduction histidine kinase